MTRGHVHARHPALMARLKRDDVHLRAVIEIIELGGPCLGVVQQLHSLEKAVAKAKRVLIHHHVVHFLDAERSPADRDAL